VSERRCGINGFAANGFAAVVEPLRSVVRVLLAGEEEDGSGVLEGVAGRRTTAPAKARKRPVTQAQDRLTKT
jgi:hypothetical protein